MLTTSSNKLPNYIYMPLQNGVADVFIYKFVSKDEEGQYIYETNEFRTKKLKEEDIAINPFKFLDYVEKEPTIEDRIAEMEEVANEAYIQAEYNAVILELLMEEL